MQKVFILFFGMVIFSSFQVEKMRDMVPDEKTAIKIAEAVWLTIYGKEIYGERPFKAILVGDSAWLVCGSLPPAKKIKGGVRITLGGVAICRIRKKDAAILQVIHGK